MKNNKLVFNYKWTFLITILSCISVLSCTDNQKSLFNNDIHLDINSNQIQEINLSSFVDSILYVRLETSKECLIGSIDKIRYLNDLFFILDKRQSKIFVFNEFGKFQYSISHKGKGPGEYLSISDFCLDTEKKQLIISDHMTRRFNFYDLKGNFQFSKQSKFTNKFCEFNNGKIAYYSDNYIMDKFNLHIWNISSEKITDYLLINPALKDFQSTDGGQFFFNYKNQLLFKEALGRTIFHIDDKIAEYITIDFGKKNIPDNFFKEKLSLLEQLYSLNDGRYAFHVTNFVELKKSIYFTFDYNLREYSCLFNKETKYCEYGLINNDIDYISFCKPLLLSDFTILSTIDALNFLNVINEIKKDRKYLAKEKAKKLIEFSDSIDYTHNPILIKYFTKQ